MKDDSTAAFDRCFKLFYYSHDTKPDEELFGGIKACNLYRDEEAREIILKYIKMITSFNVYLELGIRRKMIENKEPSSSVREDIFMIESSKIKSFHLEL